jgi:hypothetical protein
MDDIQLNHDIVQCCALENTAMNISLTYRSGVKKVKQSHNTPLEVQGGPRSGLDTEVRGKILLPLPGIEPDLPVAQSVVGHCTD